MGINDEVVLLIAIPIVMMIGISLGGLSKWILGPRSSLSFSAATLTGMLGAILGGFIAQTLNGYQRPNVLLTAALALIGTVLLLWLAERFVRKPPATAEELIRQGECGEVEFKSTARHNVRSRQRDEKIELVIAKTVAAFLNEDGGTLLIGVADDGTILGLDDDLKYMKSPDLDRFELWLRDYLSRTLGSAATATIDVTFPEVSGRTICLVRVPASPRPVFVRPAKSDAVHFFVRVGNSTRELPVDQAITYAADRFGRRSRLAR